MALNDTTNMPSGQFNTTDIGQNTTGPAATPIPGSTPIIQQNTPMVTNNIQQSKSSGSSIGGILGPIASIFGAIFAEGGYVSNKNNYNHGGYVYAEGGPTLNPNGTYGTDQTIEPPAAPQTDPRNEAMTLGYLVGALHQQDFGGTPDTLRQAAEQIKMFMDQSQSPNGVQGFDDGGEVNGTSEAEAALMTALGYNPQTGGIVEPVPGSLMNRNAPTQTNFANGQPPVPNDNMRNPMLAPQSTTGSMLPTGDSNAPPQAVTPSQMPQPTTTGFMQPVQFAGGGSSQKEMPEMFSGKSMMMGNPSGGKEHMPGEMFTSEGEVQGPGTPTSDSIPARLSDGEFVMSAAATQFFGVDKLAQMNEKGKQGFMQAMGQVEANQGAMATGGGPMGTQPGMPQQGTNMGSPPISAAQGMATKSMPPQTGYMQPPTNSLPPQMNTQPGQLPPQMGSMPGNPNIPMASRPRNMPSPAAAMRPKTSGYMGL